MWQGVDGGAGRITPTCDLGLSWLASALEVSGSEMQLMPMVNGPGPGKALLSSRMADTVCDRVRGALRGATYARSTASGGSGSDEVYRTIQGWRYSSAMDGRLAALCNEFAKAVGRYRQLGEQQF